MTLGPITQLNAERRARAVDQSVPWDRQSIMFTVSTAKRSPEFFKLVSAFTDWPKGWSPPFIYDDDMDTNVLGTVDVYFTVNTIATPGAGAFVRATLSLMA